MSRAPRCRERRESGSALVRRDRGTFGFQLLGDRNLTATIEARGARAVRLEAVGVSAPNHLPRTRLIVVVRPLLLVALMVLCACGDPAARSGAAAMGTYAPVAEVRAAQPAIVPTIAYVVSPGVGTSDVPVFIRRPGATDVRIADGVVVRGFAPDVLLVERKDGHASALRVNDGATFGERRPRGGHAAGALTLGGNLYEFSYDELVVIDAQGGTRSLAIPSALPTTTGPCRLQKGGGGSLTSSGLYSMASVRGHPYLYVATMGNGAVIDLDGARRLDLPDAGRALAMVEGADGKLYALTIDGRCASNNLQVHRIDTTTLRVESVIDVGHGLPVDHVGFVVAGGGTYIHEVTDNSAQLLRVDVSGVTSIPLPTDSGLSAAAAPDGTIYLFGGRAKNIVTRFDPRTGAIETVDAATAPNGSFVSALFFDQANAAGHASVTRVPLATTNVGIRAPGDHPRPTPRFFSSGGPYLSDLRAIEIARAAASGPIARAEAHMMSYGEVVRWIGSENLYYDRAREMYVVAVSASFEPRLGPLQEPNATPVVCNSYFVVIDATDATVLSVGCGGPSPWPLKLPSQFSAAPPTTPSGAPTSVATSGMLTRADAMAKAPAPLGDTVTRVEAKLVLRTDLAAAEKGIGGIRPEVDYVWVVARWGQFTPWRFGAGLVSADKQQQLQTPLPEGWRFLLIDARTGEPYVGGGSVAERPWWIGLPDRSGDRIR